MTPEPDYYDSHFDQWLWRVMCAAMCDDSGKEEEAPK